MKTSIKGMKNLTQRLQEPFDSKINAINILLNDKNHESSRLVRRNRDGIYFLIKREGDNKSVLFSTGGIKKTITMNNVYKNFTFSDDVLGNGEYVIR